MVNQSDDVLSLCARGVQLERVGLVSEAADQYQQAWKAAESPDERCVAAHHVARVQESADSRRTWDQTALEWLDMCDPTLIEEFAPVVQAAAATSARIAGDSAAAQQWYRQAAASARTLVDSADRAALRASVADGLLATSGDNPVVQFLARLGDERRFAALSVLLVGYVDWVVEDTTSGLIDAAKSLVARDGISQDECAGLIGALDRVR